MARLTATFSPPSSWGESPPTPYAPGITLTADQYPTEVRLSGLNLYNSFHTNTEDPRWATVYLCDSNGQNAVSLDTIGGAGWIHDWDEYTEDGITYQYRWLIPSGSQLALRGKTLAFTKSYSDVYFQGSATVTIVTSDHAVTWTNPSLSFSQNEYTLTVTMGGTATDNWGGTPTFSLLMDGVNKGTFSSSSMDITLTDSQLEIAHSFSLIATSTASGSTVSATGCTVSHTPHSVHKTVKYYNGTWIECIMYYWTGSQWQEVEPHYWNGTRWVPCSHT